MFFYFHLNFIILNQFSSKRGQSVSKVGIKQILFGIQLTLVSWILFSATDVVPDSIAYFLGFGGIMCFLLGLAFGIIGLLMRDEDR